MSLLRACCCCSGVCETTSGVNVTFAGMDANVGSECCRVGASQWAKTTTLDVDGTYNVAYDSTFESGGTWFCVYDETVDPQGEIGIDIHSNDTCTSFSSSSSSTSMRIRISVRRDDCKIVGGFAEFTGIGSIARFWEGNTVGSYGETLPNEAVCAVSPFVASGCNTTGTCTVTLP